MHDTAAFHDKLHHDLFTAGMDADGLAGEVESLLAGRPYSAVMLLDDPGLEALRHKLGRLAGCVEQAWALRGTLKKFF